VAADLTQYLFDVAIQPLAPAAAPVDENAVVDTAAADLAH